MRRIPPYVWRLVIYLVVLPLIAGVGLHMYRRHVYEEELRGGARTKRPRLQVRPGAVEPTVPKIGPAEGSAPDAPVEDQGPSDQEIIDGILAGTIRPGTGEEADAVRAAPARRQDGVPVVAILPAQRRSDDPAAAAIQAGVEDLLAVGLARFGKITVVDRAETKRILAEQRLALSGVSDDQYAVRAGQLLGASRGILVETLPVADQRWVLSASCYEIVSGRVVAAASGEVVAENVAASVQNVLDQLQANLGINLRTLSPEEIDRRPELSLHFMRAMTDLAAGECDRALLSLMRINQLDPSAADAYYWKGQAYSRLNQPAHAATELRRYLALAPEGDFAAAARSMLEQYQ